METGEQQYQSNGRRMPPTTGQWKPGQSGNPKGRRKLTPEQKEAIRLAQRAKDRAVGDIAAELRSMIGPAVDRLRKLIDDKDPAVALRAATDVISRVNGLPVATNVVATMGGHEPMRRLSAEDVAAAAKLYLTKLSPADVIEMEPR